MPARREAAQRHVLGKALEGRFRRQPDQLGLGDRGLCAHGLDDLAERLDQPPNWRSSVNRAAIAAAVFAVVIVLAFGRPIASGALLGIVMFAIYVPLGYATDSAIYRFRQRKKQAAEADRKARK